METAYLLDEGSRLGWCQESSQAWAKVSPVPSTILYLPLLSTQRPILSRRPTIFTISSEVAGIDTPNVSQLLLGLLSQSSAPDTPSSEQIAWVDQPAYFEPHDARPIGQGVSSLQLADGASALPRGPSSGMGTRNHNDENVRPRDSRTHSYQVLCVFALQIRPYFWLLLEKSYMLRDFA